jgi:uncharacterized protein (TIGR02145 family)
MKKRNKTLIPALAVIGLLLILICGCKKKNDDNIPGTVKDYDGNIYYTVQIGTQLWMAENLKTTRYNDGTEIPLVTNEQKWLDLSTPGYCWYNNDPATYKITYGALYNWYAVNTGKLAPKGWHIPTDAEWTTLSDYLGGEAIAGGKLKETGTAHWISPNTDATNEIGFTGLPGGIRHDDGEFYKIGSYGFWWGSTETGFYYAWNRFLNFGNGQINKDYFSKKDGFNVRCVRDRYD